MSKLDDFLKDGTFPIVRTGLGSDDWELQTWKRKEQNIIYKCSLCDCDIHPDDSLFTHIKRGYMVPREGISGIKNVSEIVGFHCRKCADEIFEYDNLYYG